MKSARASLFLLFLLAAGLLGKTAQADTVVYSTFGPGNAFAKNNVLHESGPGSTAGISSFGMGFTPSASGNLGTIDIALQHESGTNVAHLFLTEGIPGQNGTTTLETFTLTNLPAFTSSNPLFDTVNSSLHPQLSTGHTYYLYEQETDAVANGWNYNSIDATGTVIGSSDNINYTISSIVRQGAFRITIAAIPELSSMIVWTLFLSLGGMSVLRRRRARM